MGSKNPLASANYFQKLFLTWIGGYVNASKEKAWKQEDHYPLPVQDSVYYTKPLIKNCFDTKKGVWGAIFSAYRKECISVLIVLLLITLLNFSTAIFLTNVISTIWEAEQRNPTNVGAEIQEEVGSVTTNLVLILSVNLVYPVVNIYLNWRAYRVGMRVKQSMMAIVVDKIMKISTLNSTKYNEGTLLNYVQIDIVRVENCLSQLITILSSGTSVILGLCLIYFFIGAVVFYILLATLFMNFLYALVYMWRSAVAKKLLKGKDARIGYLKSVLKNLEYVKLSALENYYWNQINSKRAKEIRQLFINAFVSACGFFIEWLTPGITQLAIFIYFANKNSDDLDFAKFTGFMQIFEVLK